MNQFAIFIICLCHIVLFLSLIDYHHFSWGQQLILSGLMVSLMVLLVVSTGYPEFNVLVSWGFLLAIGFSCVSTKLPSHKINYFAFLTLFPIALVDSFLNQVVYQLFIVLPIPIYLSTFGLIRLIVASLLLTGCCFGRNKIKGLVEYVATGGGYTISYVLLVMGMLLLLILNEPKLELLNLLNRTMFQVGSNLMLVLLVTLFCLFFFYVHFGQEKIRQMQQAASDQELFRYTAKLEKNHEELVSFRHDYLNILMTLDEGIKKQDMVLVEQVYFETIKPTSELMSNQALDIVKLAKIKLPAIKSLLSVKVSEAQQKKVKVTLDIPQVVRYVEMDVTDFARCLAILLDNAIEEATVSEGKEVVIALFHINQELKLIVKNSCRQTTIDLKAIFQKHYSKKGAWGGRGYGLYNVKKIIDGHKYASLETVFIFPFFTQVLTIKAKSTTYANI